MDNKELVLKTLINAGKLLKSGEIINLSGLDKKDADKALNDLKTEGKIFSPKRCFWQAK
jgi:hypothetical protein